MGADDHATGIHSPGRPKAAAWRARIEGAEPAPQTQPQAEEEP